jgi:DNA-binding HxlR family transcriptional regulator
LSLSLLGGSSIVCDRRKWKGVIIFQSLSGSKRFNELHRSFQGISHHMLTVQLRELEEDGVVRRTVYPEVPPKVEYSLTPFGQSLRPILLLMREWGDEYRETVAENK